MLKNLNLKSRRLFTLLIGFVLLISLSACSTAGHPTGKLDTDAIYAKAGDYSVTNGELWNELKWNSSTILTSKFEEVVLKDYMTKIELIMEKEYTAFTAEEKELFSKDFTLQNYNDLKQTYTDRLTDYVIEDIYNFEFNPEDSFESIENVNEYEAKKLVLTYANEIYVNYGIESLNGTPFRDICTNATKNKENYIIIAKALKNLYYVSYAKELLAYDGLEEEITEAYEDRDTEDEDDLGYFKKSDFTSAYKNNFANQGDLNLILIRFASEDEYTQTLRSFGLKIYENELVYIPAPANVTTFAEYCKYYDELSMSNRVDYFAIESSAGEVAVLEIYIQIYNYLYGGYRDMIYDTSYAQYFDSIDLRVVTKSICDKYSNSTAVDIEAERKAQFDHIVSVLEQDKNSDDFNTYYSREYIDNIDSSFYTYLYETLTVPFNQSLDNDDKCYSTSVQSYNSKNWIAFKLQQDSDEYEGIYDKNTIDDDLYDNIAANEELYAKILKILKTNSITSSKITTEVNEAKADVSVKIYDEALEISYATSNSNYSKTYGSAPNSNVIATLTYKGKTYNLNIVEDTTDTNAVSGGVFTTLELQQGTTSAVDILSRKVVKSTKAYADTLEDNDSFYEQVEYVLAAFANDYYSSSGYASTIGKYNFLMLYFHTANIDDIVKNTYRVNAAASKLLTNYNSDTLLNFFKSYTDAIYNNYFSISGNRFVVYLDANDDGEKDDITEWTATQIALAKELVLKALDTVSSVNGSHLTALTSLVTEINNSGRAKYEDNPIAPENEWSKYRKAGLSVELVTVEATNSTTDIDFKLKERMLSVYNLEDFSINDTVPTEYLENLKSETDILETKDGFNLILITSADFQTSAEFTAEDDKLGIFDSIDIYYNDEYVTISNIYNENETLSIDQIRLYVLEYVMNSTSNLVPSKLSDAMTNFLSPVLTRYTATETQRDILIHFIGVIAGDIEFTSEINNNRLVSIIEINHQTADNYLSIYFEEDPTGTLKTYENWWTDIQKIVSEILLVQGESK